MDFSTETYHNQVEMIQAYLSMLFLNRKTVITNSPDQHAR